MEIIDTITLQLEHDKIVRAIFQDTISGLCWSEKVRRTLSSVKRLLIPRAIFRWFEVDRVGSASVILRDPHGNERISLEIGPHAGILAGAHMVLGSVVTLGGELDERITLLNKSSDILEAYLADCIGVYGLLQVSRVVYSQVEHFAAQKDWGISPVMSPGAIHGWNLEEQKAFCSILPIDQIGVTMNDSGVLIPHKSVSFIIGIGPGYTADKVVIPCHVCTNTGVCWCKY